MGYKNLGQVKIQSLIFVDDTIVIAECKDVKNKKIFNKTQ